MEGSETVLLGLDQPLVWPPPYIVSWPSIALGVIGDDDVAPTNQPPHVALVNPPDGSVFMAPADIKLVARVADRDGRVHRVEFFEGTNSLGIVTNQPRLIARAELLVANDDLGFDIDPDEFPDFSLDPTPIDPAVIPGSLFRLLWEDVRPGHYVLTAVATDNDGASTRSEPVEIRVTEPPPEPIVNVVAVDSIAAEGPGLTDLVDVINTATFAVRRSGNTNIPLTVYYRLSGTASNGVDYESLPHSVTIPAGARGARVVVVPIDDTLVEGRESVVLTLVQPLCIATFPPPPDCYTVGRYDTARTVIRDNDPPSTNRPPIVQIVRPLDGSVFLAPADVAIVAQARDFDGRVVSVEFFEGTNSLGIVSNNVAAITASRPPFFLVWSNVSPGHYMLSAEATDNDGATTQSRPVEIKVVERTIPPTVNIFASDPEASENGGLSSSSSPTGAVNTATFTVSRTGSTAGALRVHYSLHGSASNGVDYRKLTGDVLIPSGVASADIVVHPFDDLLVEGTEHIIASIDRSPCLSISSAALRDCYVVGTNSRALAAIRDNDVSPTNQPPKVAIVRPESGDVFLAPADIALVAEAKDADGFVRTVEFFANGTSLGIVSNHNAAVIDEVLSVDDFFRLKWSNVLAGDYVLTARATDNRGAMTTSDPIRVRVVFPAPPVVTIEARDPYASEGGLHATSANSIGITPIPVSDTATFIVSRSRGTNDPLTVYYRLSGSASNGGDYRELSGEVTIPSGAWRAEIVVDPIDDNLAEHTETVVATLAPVLCAHVVPIPLGCYQVGEPHRAVAYIRDNDINRLPRVEIIEPTDGDVFPALSDIEIDVLARDSDGYVWRVEFFAGTNKIGEDLRLFFVPPPPGQVQKFSMIWSNVPAGDYKLWAKATDDRGGMTISDGVRIFVVDRTRVPVVTIETVDKVATEQSPFIDSVPDTGLFVVTRTGETNRPLVVFYNTSGSASNGVDYRRLSGEVTIAAGETSARIILEALDDNLVERTETVVLALEKPDCPEVNALSPTPVSRGCYLVGKSGRAIAYIRDNDSPPNEGPHIAILMPDEGETFEAPADIEILAVGLDPDGWITQVEFFEGTNQIGGLAILVGDPPPHGELQTFQFNWEDVRPGNYTLTARATDNSGEATVSGPIHIRVFDPCRVPVVTITATDPVASEPRLNSTAATIDLGVFTVRRNCGFDRSLLVHYRVTGTASNGVDYVALTGEVLFQAGDSAARIVVNPLDDNLAEGTERVVVELVQRPCLTIDPPPADCYLVSRPNRSVVYIRDNDSHEPRIAITSPHNGAVFHAPADVPVMAQALDPDGWVTQVEFFANSNLIGLATVNFFVEPPPGQLQTFDIRWTNVAVGNYVLIARATDNNGDAAWSDRVEIRVVPPPSIPTVTIVARDPYVTEGGTNTATFRVRRDCCGGDALTVWYAITGSASNGVDYASLSSYVTIPAGARSAPIVIVPVDDRVPESIETVVLELQQPPTGSPILTYHIGQPEAAAAIIVDNDQPLPVSQRLVDGLVHLCVPAVDRACYRIEATSDFVNWEVLCRNTARGNTLHFVEPRGRELPRRFYRVVPDICDEEE